MQNIFEKKIENKKEHYIKIDDKIYRNELENEITKIDEIGNIVSQISSISQWKDRSVAAIQKEYEEKISQLNQMKLELEKLNKS